MIRGINEDSHKIYEFERVEDSLLEENEEYELKIIEDSLEFEKIVEKENEDCEMKRVEDSLEFEKIAEEEDGDCELEIVDRSYECFCIIDLFAYIHLKMRKNFDPREDIDDTLISTDLGRNQKTKTKKQQSAQPPTRSRSATTLPRRRKRDGSKTKKVEANQTTTEAEPHHINVDETQSANAADTTAERCG
ncbi:hypothetical protein P8452_36427 [Trifolium repens]|nr:hypothetical protein P8452_36427 [Trifolium repens]